MLHHSCKIFNTVIHFWVLEKFSWRTAFIPSQPIKGNPTFKKNYRFFYVKWLERSCPFVNYYKGG
jgi:hypothetical protein